MMVLAGAAAGNSAVEFYRLASILKVKRVVRPLRGGSRSFLVLCDDNKAYVLKLLNNPQGPKVLANEWLGGIVAAALGIQVSTYQAIELVKDVICEARKSAIGTEDDLRQLSPGLHLGVCFVGSLVGSCRPLEYLPFSFSVINGCDAARMALLDLWANTTDSRECIYLQQGGKPLAIAFYIDHGHMFGGPRWSNRSEEIYQNAYLLTTKLGLTIKANPSWISLMQDKLPKALEIACMTMPSEWYPLGRLASTQSFYLRRLEHLQEIVMKALDFVTGPSEIYDHTQEARLHHLRGDVLGVGHTWCSVSSRHLVR